MATVTVTSTAAANTLRQTHANIDTVSFSLSTGTFGGAGDTVLLARIPNQATVTGATVRFVSPSDTAVALEVLIGTDPVIATFTASNSGGAAVARWNGIPVKCSTSDDAANSWRYIYAKVVNAGTQTATGSISGAITYGVNVS